MRAVAIFAFVAAFAAVGAAAAGTNYAVLVAGSNGYYNYRHQSDVCHAFQVLTDPNKGNFPSDNVIVMMYDDIANDPSNPFPGNIINHPNGTNVYPGVNKDYTGVAVTPSNFLAVLSQNASGVSGGSGRVLKSGPEDNVFVYFSDHGAPGLIAFPSEYLYADQLIKTLTYMHENKMYRQMVIYIEACESGSMFEGLLPPNINIYATTASTKDQSSYACYWDATRNAYLGDEYSVRWLEDSDAHDGSDNQWSLLDQFQVVVNQTLQSQPQKYGDFSIDTEAIDDFQGFNNFDGADSKHRPAPVASESMAVGFVPCGNAVSSRDVKLHTLVNRRNALRLSANRQEDIAEDLQQSLEEAESAVGAELAERAWWDAVFENALTEVVGARNVDTVKTGHALPRNFECIREVMDSVEQSCGRFTDYSLKWVYTLVNLCEKQMPLQTVMDAFARSCSSL